MQNYCFDQSQADTILFSTYAVLRESGYSGPVVIDVADTDAYVAAAFISLQLPSMFCIKRKQEIVLCHGLVTEEMADCSTALHAVMPTRDSMAKSSHHYMTRWQRAL